MNKSRLIEAVQERIGGTKSAIEETVEAIFDVITETISKENVNIAGFGMFLAKKRSARMGINPKTGEKMHIAATVTPKFRAGKVLKEAVK